MGLQHSGLIFWGAENYPAIRDMRKELWPFVHKIEVWRFCELSELGYSTLNFELTKDSLPYNSCYVYDNRIDVMMLLLFNGQIMHEMHITNIKTKGGVLLTKKEDILDFLTS